jgi:hypothetical protein
VNAAKFVTNGRNILKHGSLAGVEKVEDHVEHGKFSFSFEMIFFTVRFQL